MSFIEFLFENESQQRSLLQESMLSPAHQGNSAATRQQELLLTRDPEVIKYETELANDRHQEYLTTYWWHCWLKPNLE